MTSFRTGTARARLGRPADGKPIAAIGQRSKGWVVPGTEESPSTADRALLRAARAWGVPGEDIPWGRFAPDWRERLQAAWPAARRASSRSARDGLRRDHEASTRPDPARIHPSWYVRALRPESAAVRMAVATHASPAIREALRGDPGWEGDGTRPVHSPDPVALGWALALWAERLVGDVPGRADDPPAVVALTRLRPRDLARLVAACGQAKHAFAIEGHGPSGADEERVRMTAVGRVRLGFFRRLIGAADPRLVPAARADLGAIGPDPRRGHSRLGLLSFGRLLALSEPHRARWAIQHIPYPIAREMREKGEPPLPPRALEAWESWILEAAWARLLAEGRLERPPGGPP
jgi:hypothetical protein